MDKTYGTTDYLWDTNPPRRTWKNDLSGFFYDGDSISFNEMPYGCEIVQHGKTVVIESLKDAVALRDSLNKMIDSLNRKQNEVQE